MAWRGYSSYGKSALGITLSLNGFDKLLERVQQAGNNVDGACKNAVNASEPIIENAIKEGAARHQKTGAVYNAIESVPAKQEGNLIYGEVGVNVEKYPNAAHAVFQEYGDGHSPEFPDPFIRPAIDNNKSTVRKIMRQELKKAGILNG